VGYQAHDPAGDEHPEMVLDSLVRAVKATGGIGVVGVYVPSDPQAASQGAQQGRIGFDYGRRSASALACAAHWADSFLSASICPRYPGSRIYVVQRRIGSGRGPYPGRVSPPMGARTSPE
jgi:hypothetical protein